ncbi:MAG: ADP-ribosylation factor-like protein [Myxococcales bacterium]|nr:ADP-ribosylation factor-like protein [Myxococcales bacterium]
MAYIDHARREARLKIVYYGPGLGGKTTNLEWLHRTSRPERRGKLLALNDASERTVFFDLLPVELGTYRGYTIRLHLCTVPGQIAQNRVRQLVLRHVDGIVMVVDSQQGRINENLGSIENLAENLRAQGDDPGKMPMVVQYNKQDLDSALEVFRLRELLGVPDEVEQVAAVAVRGEGVIETLKAITRACLSLIDDPQHAPAGRNPSIIPGRHSSMFPEARPAALGSDEHSAHSELPPMPRPPREVDEQ